MEELSDGGGLSDGDNSLPPRHKHYVRHVQEALQNTLQDLAQLQEQVVPEPIRENKKQQQALTRLLNGWQRRRGDPDGNVPLSPMGRGVEYKKNNAEDLEKHYGLSMSVGVAPFGACSFKAIRWETWGMRQLQRGVEGRRGKGDAHQN